VTTIVTSRLAALACLAIFGGPGAAAASAQAAAPDPNAWTVEYTIAGGFAGFVHSITVQHTGDLEAIDSRLRYHARSRASEDLMTRIRAALGKLVEPRPPRTYPDLPYATLLVTRNGHHYAFADQGDLVNRLEEAFGSAVSGAVQGTWWQSGWKLCKPAATLTRDDVDVPIETLELRKDGTFHLTWGKGIRGGHPASTEDGTWRLDRRIAAFHIAPTDSVLLRDLKPDGWFSINENTLTLRDVWFGTVQAAHAPDICELTFTRK
jgi:hypothetical protein